MHADAPRINGGIGFAMNGPQATIEARPAACIDIEDQRRFPMTAAELRQLGEALTAFAKIYSDNLGARISVYGEMRTHVGMGSASAIRLGVLEALALANGRDVTRDALITASGRGGTSGIGINTYFDGGLVCDLGRAGNDGGFLPSSQATGGRPLTLPSLEMPNWPILLCIPRAIAPKTQEEEVAFFKRTTPLPASTSYQTSYVALFELYAAAAEADFDRFCCGVEHMQDMAWKRAERAAYGQPLSEISSQLIAAGGRCVGMSSLGPMLFCLFEPDQLATLTEAADRLGCDTHAVRPVNHGRAVVYADA